MSYDISKYLNDTDNTLKPNLKRIIKNIDTNNDGFISDSELIQLKEEDPLQYASIFEFISGQDTKNASFNDGFISGEAGENTTTSDSGENNNKNISINISELDGIDVDEFNKISQNLGDDNNSKFWQSLSGYDLNKLFNYINTDNDNLLSNEELMKLSLLDGNNENLSLYDLNDFINSLGENTAEDTSVEDSQAVEENTISPKKDKRSQKSGGGHISGNNNTSAPEIDKKTELTNKLNSSQKEFNNAKTKYTDVLDGNINDSEVQEKKEAMDQAYSAWQEELQKEDPELSQNIDNAKNEVETIKQDLLQNEKEIFNNEINLEDCEIAYDSAVSYREGLESKRSELQSALSGLDSSNETDAKRIKSYQNQIDSINTEIESAKTKEEAAKRAKEAAKKALDDSKAQKTTLESQLSQKEETLSELTAKADKLGENNPALVRLQQDYESKKQTYENALKEYKERLLTEATGKHNEVIQNQKLLSDYENTEKTESFNAIFGEYDSEFADIFNKYLLEGASDHSKSDCGGAVRRAMYKATLEKYGQEVAEIFKEGYGVIGGDWNNQYLDNCPLFTDVTDLYSTSEIEEMINNGELEGAIINYEKYPGSTNGHVEGVTTKGLTSDYTRPHSYFRSKSSLGQAKYHIYVPRVASDKEIEQYIQLMISRKQSYKSPL